jgi:mRNA-degrading endonuclease toxin of MazEF toxin-antitoxin module
VVKCEQVSRLDKTLLETRPLGGPLSDDRIRQVEDALLIALGIFHR